MHLFCKLTSRRQCIQVHGALQRQSGGERSCAAEENVRGSGSAALRHREGKGSNDEWKLGKKKNVSGLKKIELFNAQVYVATIILVHRILISELCLINKGPSIL